MLPSCWDERVAFESKFVSDDALREEKWLNEELGLCFNPFQHLDAGADPRLPVYLINQGSFADLWGDWLTLLFAPAGGGKTAYRVRLARSCRVEQDGRQVFPIIFRPPRAKAADVPSDETQYLEMLSRDTGTALLLQLAYRPGRFLNLTTALQMETRLALERNLPGSLDYYLSQLEDAGSINPLAQAFDPTAVGLPAEPSSHRITKFCAAVRGTPSRSNGLSDPGDRFRHITELLIDGLGYESMYLLVDGVDAYIQEPAFAILLLDPLLSRLRAWEDQALFVKFFLPEELQASLLKNERRSLLTETAKVVTIEWGVNSLVEVIRERLRAASAGIYDSLEAISARDVSDHIEERLAKRVFPQVPREIILLTRRVFSEHILRVGPYGRLQQRDYEAAYRWYEKR